eukprot:TRINITY_DN3812_c0_g1_i5.p1 TRINITY_DN3812_c0_g1~~TRINITY_DN3812_c0_g1_i5.p1  ORF type:complete len:210 (-),score=50.97 TRINITY_DN3812_c0_g1_i5:54-683(-)
MYRVRSNASRVTNLISTNTTSVSTSSVVKRWYAPSLRMKHTPEKEPWLFLSSSIDEHLASLDASEKQRKYGEPEGSEFQSIRISQENIINAKRLRFSETLIKFRETYESPLVSAYRLVDKQLEEERAAKRSLSRKMIREKQRQNNNNGGSIVERKNKKLTRAEEAVQHYTPWFDSSLIGSFSEVPSMDNYLEHVVFFFFIVDYRVVVSC